MAEKRPLQSDSEWLFIDSKGSIFSRQTLGVHDSRSLTNNLSTGLLAFVK